MHNKRLLGQQDALKNLSPPSSPTVSEPGKKVGVILSPQAAAQLIKRNNELAHAIGMAETYLEQIYETNRSGNEIPSQLIDSIGAWLDHSREVFFTYEKNDAELEDQ